MTISIFNPILQTNIFAFFLVVALLISLRFNTQKDLFPYSLTNELKGFAIFAVLFAHIGYQLAPGTNYLFPLSILGGVGVNIFLFLSGFGLAISSVKKSTSLLTFYRKRLIKIYIPLWLTLVTFLSLDLIFLQKLYPLKEIIQSFMGIFTRADIGININSPLWYFTIVLFYYLIFPLFFIKNKLYLTSLAVFTLSFLILEKITLPVHQDNITIYKLHTLAFPLGILFAFFYLNEKSFFTKTLIFLKSANFILKIFFLIILSILIYYFSINAGVGQGVRIEQKIAVLNTLLIILWFFIKNFQFKLLNLFGIFSYEIYLLHWPILFRYDYLFKTLPAWLATITYLIIFLLLAYLLQKLTNLILKSRG